MIHAALILTLIIPSVSDRSRGGGTAFDGVFEFDADLDGIYKLYGDKTDDSNTYIYRSGADEWTVVSGGVDALICDASYCTFTSGPKVGASIPFADAAGTLTLQNIDALDATTETTIEGAIDTLGDISVGGIAQGDDKSVCQGADTDFCCEWDTDSTEGLLCTAADCDGLGGSCTAAHVYEDSGNLIADLKGIDSITNSSQKITVGPPGVSSYSLGANELHSTCARNEFNGALYVKSNIYLSANVGIKYPSYEGIPRYTPLDTHQTNYVSLLVTPTASNTLLLLPSGYSADNYSIAAQTDQTIIGVADQDPASDATKYFMLSWNRLALGGGGGAISGINQTIAYDEFVDGGGTSGTLVLDEGIPAGSYVRQVLVHSIDPGFTGDTSAVIQVGDGTDPDRYNTGTPDVYTVNSAGVDMGTPSGTVFHSAAKSITVTITTATDWGLVSAGELTIHLRLDRP